MHKDTRTCRYMIGGNILSLFPSTSDTSNLLKSTDNGQRVAGEMCVCIFSHWAPQEREFPVTLQDLETLPGREKMGMQAVVKKEKMIFKAENESEGPRFTGVPFDPGVLFDLGFLPP